MIGPGVVLTQGLAPPNKVKRPWPAGPLLLWSPRQNRKKKKLLKAKIPRIILGG